MKNESEHSSQYPNAPYFSKRTLLCVSLIITLCMVYPPDDEHIISLISQRWYYVMVIIVFLATILKLLMIHLLNVLLDKKYGWEKGFRKRLLLQLLLAWIGPIVLSFSITWIYFWYLNADIMATLYTSQMLKNVLFIGILINFSYVLGYYINLDKIGTEIARRALQDLQAMTLLRLQQDKKIREQRKLKRRRVWRQRLKAKQVKNYKKYFVVSEGMSLTKICVSDIAYFFKSEKHVLLRTFESKMLTLNPSLDSIEDELDPDYFFRANRAYIISRKSFVSTCKHPKKSRCKLMRLVPSTNPDIELSSDKARKFKIWMQRFPAGL